MNKYTLVLSGFFCLLLSLLPVHFLFSTENTQVTTRQQAQKLQKEGNYREALEIFQKLLDDKENKGPSVAKDLNNAYHCLKKLYKINELDSLLEKAIEIHRENWHLLSQAGQLYHRTDHYGYLLAGEFQRAPRRGSGKYVYSYKRDKRRALQLMQQALDNSQNDLDKKKRARFLLTFASMILSDHRGNFTSWHLQSLTDLDTLPDYEEQYDYGGSHRGAPVDPDGNPLFYHQPSSWKQAQNDGERWRWLLKRATELDSDLNAEAAYEFASFWHRQFGVQTLITHWYGLREESKSHSQKNETGIYAVHTLKKNETIANLATGIKRFQLPDEFNFIDLFQKITRENPQNAYSERALDQLASLFENRHQFDVAAQYWEKSIERFGLIGLKNFKQKRLSQIIDNWGRFDGTKTHPQGKEVSLGYVFRNGERVTFTAHKIKVEKLLQDMKSYIKSKPRKFDRQEINLHRIGYRLVVENQRQYIDERVAQWTLDLKPREKHWDKRAEVKTPLHKSGAYLVKAEMEGGNTSYLVVWITDTVIVKKPLHKESLYFVADAVTGAPIEKAHVEFFGYETKYRDKKTLFGRTHDIDFTQFAEFTNQNGMVILSRKKSQNYRWLVTASTQDGRHAFLGFSRVWQADYADQHYHQTKYFGPQTNFTQTKYFGITDRPVYRPGQQVDFKIWIRKTQYDQDTTSQFANQSFQVIVYNPKKEKVLEQEFTTDAYGGLAGNLTLEEEATLGNYVIVVNVGKNPHPTVYSTHHTVYFRVEEYKKPEYGVTIDGPKEPIMLGEQIKATIKAQYYFGAPVTQATVNYKILRYHHAANWYPPMPWDWFYGPGYWWFAPEYTWYPGWKQWGCPPPYPHWFPEQYAPPELVSENEVAIGQDGTVNIEIDTALAKEMHGESDHRYEITAEVVDQSRRIIYGKGEVLVAHQPFKVYSWTNRGYYQVGDTILAHFHAKTLDNKPIQGKGKLTIYKIEYDKDWQPQEKAIAHWEVDTNEEGNAQKTIKATQPGQFRISYQLSNQQGATREGGYLFTVRGPGFDGKDFRFQDLELITDKKEYRPGEKVKVMLNTNRANSTVVLFVRPTNGVYPKPKILRLQGKSTITEIDVVKKDMPNFFIEAFTISKGRYYSKTKEVVVPPEKRVLTVDVLPSTEKYKPGEKATVQIKVTDFHGNPFQGSTVVTIYDKALEYISGGSNVPDIKEFFWKWRRWHSPSGEHTLKKWFSNITKSERHRMKNLGVFGDSIADESRTRKKLKGGESDEIGSFRGPQALTEELERKPFSTNQSPGTTSAEIIPIIRKNFSDRAFWTNSLTTDAEGMAEIDVDLPENLTTWKVKTWGMGHGTKVGSGETEFITSKDLLIRLQAPRFFTQSDEVLLSANVHNYLKETKQVTVRLELEGETVTPVSTTNLTKRVEIPAHGEKRIDWLVRAQEPGNIIVRMKALTDEESDAMQKTFPVYVHGILKTESWSGSIRPDEETSSLHFHIPEERKPEQTQLEIRYSPSLAGALVDALPYLVHYPYGCTEQTLNRFLPTVITQNILQKMNIDLQAVKEKRTNLNAQEIGDTQERTQPWKQSEKNPVFDEKEVENRVKEGLNHLTAMQNRDGGWGWFSGRGERSYPHTTAYVVRGLQVAQENDVAIVKGVIERGVAWLKQYQKGELQKLRHAKTKKKSWKSKADNLDAFVYMVLADANLKNEEMLLYLYRDRIHLSVYGKTLFALALHRQGEKEKCAMLVRNIEQYLVQDKENQTAYLDLPNQRYWWFWYGSEHEAHAYYLKLLAELKPKSEIASGLVKYLINNRKHATYWNSTRDTALCVEAIADYLKASGEDEPDLTVEIFIDGKKEKEVKINRENLFNFENTLLFQGDALDAGKHTLKVDKKGKGPLYFNAYLTNFTTEDFITKTGLEIKVNRKYYKLQRKKASIKVPGSHGQVLNQAVEKYARQELRPGDALKSGDLIEIELIVESKNDYEYLVFEDKKAAGCEPVDLQSGYTDEGIRAYRELRDEKVVFFLQELPRGTHSLRYRVRAEIPGKFSALPTQAKAMYAPELRANSDEAKLTIIDRE